MDQLLTIGKTRFNSRENLQTWLDTPHHALLGMTPRTYAHASSACAETVLGLIEALPVLRHEVRP